MYNANAFFKIKEPANEPVLGYAPGSPERGRLLAELERQAGQRIEIPVIVGGREVLTGDTFEVVMPHHHGHVLAVCHQAGEAEIRQAIVAALEAKKEWENLPWVERASIALKAAELITTKYRYILNAATILGQSKNPHQAEIDSACELADFFRFNAFYMTEIYKEQPNSLPGTYNRVEYRPLEGFVFAVSPFNFTSIAGNLPTAPALMGNVVLWKPSSDAILSGYYMTQLFREAGFPDGVINFIPGSGRTIGGIVLPHPDLAGIHFTGSTGVFNTMWRTVAENIGTYKSYPRIVGETGGKNFVIAHPSADLESLNTALVRGAFEYQGQKCSAVSRAYIPRSLWPEIRRRLSETIMSIEVGDPRELHLFYNAVINEGSYDKIMSYIEQARNAREAEIIFGGRGDKSRGYFIEPTVILTRDPHFVTMTEEIFGPVLTVYVYEDDRYEEILHICDRTSPYALTGSIFSTERKPIQLAFEALRHAAGNFYINDKPTGAVVGEQPFGGGRASGTNDKAGSMLNLLRWTSPRTIKETFCPPQDYRYPFMEREKLAPGLEEKGFFQLSEKTSKRKVR